MNKGIVAAIVTTIVVLVVAWGGWLFTRMSAPGGGQDAGAVSIGGPFTLIDQHGRTVTEQDFRGRLHLVYFGFTFCPDVCPTELQTISAALDRLGDKAGEVVPVFISVDPERDKPEVLAAYLKDFSPRIVGLTGTPEQVAQAARAYRVYYAKAPSQDGKDYSVDHSNIVYLMGQDGQFLAHFSMRTTAEEMADTIRRHL